MSVTGSIQRIAAEIEPRIIEMRRHFHRHPEPSLHEVSTTDDIARELDALGIPYVRPLKTGLIATLRGGAADAYGADGAPRRRILLRADIDALPVTEETGLPFASENSGFMHACGHDCHIAMLLGALSILTRIRDELHGEVRAVFQPSEENGRGAQMMVEAGAAEGVDGAFALHVWSEVDAGLVSCEPGPRMANTDWFRVDIEGAGCHGAMPERGADAIVAVAGVIGALQTITSRELSPYEPAVVTVGEVHGGTARNVVAASAYLTGTVRTYSAEAHARMPELIERIGRKVAEALGCTARLTEYTVAHPAVVNDEAAAARCRSSAAKVLGEDALTRYRGTLSGEDLSIFLREVPGVLAFLGVRNAEVGAIWPQHSPRYTVDESALVKGAMLTAQHAVDSLGE